MSIKPCRCPQCGANIDQSPDNQVAVCSNCGSQLIIDPPQQATTPRRRREPKKSKLRAFGVVMGRIGIAFGTLILVLVICLSLVLSLIFNGPSEAARNVLVMSLLEPSGTKWIPPLFLSKETINEIRGSKGAELDEEFDASQVQIDMDAILNGNSDEWKNYPDGIRIESHRGETYTAHIMIIRDPSQVYMATSNDPFSKDKPGLRITQAIEREGAIAAINAGAFYDNGTSSPVVGSVPEGLVIAGGKVVWNKIEMGVPENGFAGFNQDNILVVAHSMTAKKAMDLGIRDGCCFGPVLVMNGQVNEKVYNGNSGYNPRTAIGQRADGAVIFVCVDGRQANSLGGTYKDVIDIMIEYGAVNACNLDGGSSSVMLYRDEYGRYGEKGKVQMINNYSLLQSEPRKMPNFFMVAPKED